MSDPVCPGAGTFSAFYRGSGVPLDGEDDDERTRNADVRPSPRERGYDARWRRTRKR